MDEIRYFDRYRQTTCVEQVYGDKALRWTYGTIAGRIALRLLIKRAIFSRWYGWRMDRRASRKKIAPFIERYDVDPAEFLDDAATFRNFNEFFSRRLKPSARPVHPDPNVAVFPADGRHLCVPDVARAEGLFIKGEMFDLATLLGDRRLAERYARGSLLLSRLCPVDYHRFHFPAAGIPGPTRPIPGPLYSVNPLALRRNIGILASNKRCLTEFVTDRFGTVLLVEVGATCVGSICQTYAPEAAVLKGQEKGYFRFGGSSTITLFEPKRIRFDQDLIDNSRQQRELYALMGDRLGVAEDRPA